MFEIKYRITDPVEKLKLMTANDFDKDSIIEGFIMLNFDGNVCGYYHDRILKEGEQGFEILTTWFELLIEVVIRLRTKKYLLLSKIESYNSLLEFKREGDVILVSEILDENKEGVAIKETINANLKYGDFHDAKISYLEFTKEINDKVKLFIDDLKNINSQLINSKTITNIIKKVQNLMN